MIDNKQPVEKVIRGAHAGELDLHSIFFTIQGEGPFCGTPAVFIRLAGCNLQCPMCDTEYTKDRRIASIWDMINEVQDLMPKGLVVITGGEPFRQPIGDLLHGLTNAGYYVQVETNGTLPPPDFIAYEKNTGRRKGVYIVCSPKTGKVHFQTWAAACCAKYVLDCAHYYYDDGLPTKALGHVANPILARPPMGFHFPIYLQPADEQDAAKNDANTKLVVASAMKFGYIVQVQLHKLLNME